MAKKGFIENSKGSRSLRRLGGILTLFVSFTLIGISVFSGDKDYLEAGMFFGGLYAGLIGSTAVNVSYMRKK